MADPKILIVEDDHMIAELLAYNLKEAGYAPAIFQDGNRLFQALEQDDHEAPELFILDLMLPGPDGYEICKRLRQMSRFAWVPILMLTARGSEADKVRGLDSGADDYLTKPFGMKELLARVNALLRRAYRTNTVNEHQTVTGNPATDNRTDNRTASNRAAGHPADDAGQAFAPQPDGQTEKTGYDGIYRCGNVVLDDMRHRVQKDDKEIEMTNREYELLKFLMINRGIAFSRDDLLNHVWGFEYGGETKTVDVHIRQLRRKIEDNDAEPLMIETVRGRGYRFNDQIS